MINKFKVGDFVKLRPNAVVMQQYKGAEFYVVAKAGFPWITLVTSNGRSIFTYPDEIELTKPPGDSSYLTWLEEELVQANNKTRRLNRKLVRVTAERNSLQARYGESLEEMKGKFDEYLIDDVIATNREFEAAVTTPEAMECYERIMGSPKVKWHAEIDFSKEMVVIHGDVKYLKIAHPHGKVEFRGRVSDIGRAPDVIYNDERHEYHHYRYWKSNLTLDKDYETISILCPEKDVIICGDVEFLNMVK